MKKHDQVSLQSTFLALLKTRIGKLVDDFTTPVCVSKQSSKLSKLYMLVLCYFKREIEYKKKIRNKYK